MSATTINPLPSLIRASAWDAGNQSARGAGRTSWSEEDYDAACTTQERLITACYSMAGDESGSPVRYIRFSIAEQMEREGAFTLKSNVKQIFTTIDQALAA